MECLVPAPLLHGEGSRGYSDHGVREAGAMFSTPSSAQKLKKVKAPRLRTLLVSANRTPSMIYTPKSFPGLAAALCLAKRPAEHCGSPLITYLLPFLRAA